MKGYEFGGKYSQDPIGSHESRGKNREQRKAARDGKSWTPTERRIKNELMRQFMKNPEGGGIGNSAAYRNAECWCPKCERRFRADGEEFCVLCLS